MPDITMCTGCETTGSTKRICPMRDGCYRYVAVPSPGRQSYFAKLPLAVDPIDCAYFSPVGPLRGVGNE